MTEGIAKQERKFDQYMEENRTLSISNVWDRVWDLEIELLALQQLANDHNRRMYLKHLDAGEHPCGTLGQSVDYRKQL